MDSDEVRNELEIHLRKKMYWDHGFAQSSDEYVEWVQETAAQAHPLPGDSGLDWREQILRERRKEFYVSGSPETLELNVQDHVRAALPLLLKRRETSGQKGPVTDAELHEVSIDLLKARFLVVLDEVLAELQATSDSRRKSELLVIQEDLEAFFSDLELSRRDPNHDPVRRLDARLRARGELG